LTQKVTHIGKLLHMEIPLSHIVLKIFWGFVLGEVCHHTTIIFFCIHGWHHHIIIIIQTAEFVTFIEAYYWPFLITNEFLCNIMRY